jgi:hypothetical protein
MSTSSVIAAARPPRRRFLALFPVLATSTAITSAPAAPATGADRDPLEVLWTEYQVLQKRIDAAYDELDAAYDRAREEHPAYPKSLFERRRSLETGEVRTHRLEREEIERRIEQHQLWSSEQVAAGRWALKLRLYEQWSAKVDAIEAKHGVRTHERTISALQDERDRLRAKIHEAKATSPHGAYIKLLVAHESCNPNDEGDYGIVPDAKLIVSVLNDLATMGGGR